MPDPYKILGVDKSASAAEIKSAYRKLAKKLHPDVNPGRKDIEQKFKEITAAYDLLSDADKRKRFDRGELDGQGNERGFAGAGADPFGGARNWGSYTRSGRGADPFAGINPEDIFAEFMGAARGGGGGRSRKQAEPARGADVTYALNVPFAEASLGTKRRVTLESGKTIDVTIPPGTNEGDKLRLRGQGQAGAAGDAGDAIIEIHLEPHPHFVRKDNDILLDVPISLPEALSGASIKVPTLDGHVSLKVPKGANTGTTLRLKGKGIPAGKNNHGDMFAKLKIILPDPVPDDLTELVEEWAKKNAYDPRKKLGWE